MLRNLKVPHKSSEIFSVILPIFKVSMNLAHIKCLSMLLGALCAVQTVCLSKLAGAFDSKASRESCFRRIPRFMSQRFIRLFGRDSIKCLVADREFVGNEWFKWLNDNAIQYHIRIRDNFWVEDPRTNRNIRAQHIFANLKHGEERVLYRIYRICGELCYLSGAVIKDKTGKPEPQILVSFCRPEEALPAYKERWTIETMFKGLKSSGFNIEDTHMVHINRIEQLFGVVIIAYTWAYCVGIAANIKVKAVRVLKNGRSAISLVKYGLNFIADALLNPFRPSKINVFDFLSCT